MVDAATPTTFTIDYRWTHRLARDTRAARGENIDDNGDRTAGWVITCRDDTGTVTFITGKTGSLADVANRTMAAFINSHGPTISSRVRHTVAGSTAEFRTHVGAAFELRLANAA